MRKRILSVLLILSLSVGMFPTTVMATPEDDESKSRQIVYSDDATVHFAGKEPVYEEAGEVMYLRSVVQKIWTKNRR